MIAGRIVETLAVLVAVTFGALVLYYVVGLWLVVWGTL